MTGLPQVHADQADGVSTWWVDTELPTLSASLIFRRGFADETLTTSGWSHLLEHLVLHGAWPADVAVNGSTDPLYTSLDVAGEPPRVAETLAEFVRRLRAVADGEAPIAHEAAVLRAEAGTRPVGAVRESLLYRYGARGVGLLGYTEPGLVRATPRDLAALAASVFTVGNAALALDGPIPETLRLDLPTGPLMATPPIERCADQDGRAYRHQAPEVCLTGEVPRTYASAALTRILARRVQDALRHDQALAYAPWVDYLRVSGETAVLVAGTDAAREHVGQAVHALRWTLDALATTGPTADEVDQDRRNALRGIDDPRTRAGLPWAAACEHLLGRPPLRAESIRRETEEVTVELVRAAAEQARATSLMGVPAGTDAADIDMPPLTPPNELRDYQEAPEWTTYRPLPAPAGCPASGSPGGAPPCAVTPTRCASASRQSPASPPGPTGAAWCSAGTAMP